MTFYTFLKARCIAVSLLTAMVLFLSTVAPAAPEPESTLDNFLHTIKTQTAGVTSMSCSFTQTKTLAMFDEPVIFAGSLTLIRPDRLRWEFSSPVFSALIFNGKEGRRCSETEPPVHFDLQSDPVMGMVAKQLWTWLDGNYKKLEHDYHLATPAPHVLTITPLSADTASVISQITITFGEKDRQPRQVRIDEAGGDSTLIEFSDAVINPDLPESLFTQCTRNE